MLRRSLRRIFPRRECGNTVSFKEHNGAASVELTLDDLRDINSASSKIKLEGTRYPAGLEQMTGR